MVQKLERLGIEAVNEANYVLIELEDPNSEDFLTVSWAICEFFIIKVNIESELTQIEKEP